MHISKETKVNDLLSQYPFLENFLVELNPRYRNLKNPLMRNTIGRIATISQVASVGGENVDKLISLLEAEITRQGREGFQAFAGKKYIDPKKQAKLKDIIHALHQGEDINELKSRFKQLTEEISATEIADLEQSLIDEGLPEKEVRRLCDLHVAVFEESLAGEPPQVEAGHPVNTFMLENREAEKRISQLTGLLDSCGTQPDVSRLNQHAEQFSELLAELSAIVTHYTRKENQLFPLLEKHGITAPSKVMWGIHDDIRSLLKQVRRELDAEEYLKMAATLEDLRQQMSSMIYKEEHILYPMAMDVLPLQDWQVVRHGEEEIGYAWLETVQPWEAAMNKENEKPAMRGMLALRTGSMSLEMVNLMLMNLPVDITLVDENDRVLYYSDCAERIFPRSPAVIGRSVQNCHPADSVDKVNAILKAFRSGEQKYAQFWINFGGRFIYIQYFAVFDEQGHYRGCLESSQDVTAIRALEGEKRLLDW